MQELKTIEIEKLDNVTGGSEAGDVCRDAWSAGGAVIGGALTSESGGWGALPGALVGGFLGRHLCPR